MTQLTDDQTQALAALKERVGQLDPSTKDYDLIRFLVARDWNVEKAAGMYEEWKEWWNTPLIDSGSPTVTPSQILDQVEDENEDVYRRLTPHYNYGWDKEQQPVYWEKTGLISGRFAQLREHLSPDALVIRHIRQQEITMRRFKHTKCVTGKQVAVFDMQNISLSLNGEALKVFRRTLDIDQKFYPERLCTVFFINTPWVFQPLWAMIRLWIDKKTVNKFQVLGGNYLDTLTQFISLDQIPVEYGGTCEDFTWEWPYHHKAGCSPDQLREK